jgi:cytochrome P450
MGTPFIVLNNLEDAEELLNKRANIYSGRPIHVIVTTLMDFGWSMVMRQPGKDFNEQRKVFRRAVGPQAVSQYDALMEHEAARLVSSLSGYAGDVEGKLDT